MKPLDYGILCACVCLMSCNLFPKKTEAKAPPSTVKTAKSPQYIGKISMLSGDQSYVLIQSDSPIALNHGTMLSTRGNDQNTASLIYTGEKMGLFSAADIKAGLPKVGDLVYQVFVPIEQSNAPLTPEKPSLPDSSTPKVNNAEASSTSSP